jgi:hypothetical protein
MELEALSWVSQICIAVAAVFASIFGLIEYTRALANKKIDIAIAAIKGWDDRIDTYTSAAIDLVSKNGSDQYIMDCLKNNQKIPAKDTSHDGSRYNFLINSDGEIPAESVNALRLSLVRYLNASEGVVELYHANRADKKIIEEQFNPNVRRNVFLRLEPFMNLYGADSWSHVREMMRRVS